MTRMTETLPDLTYRYQILKPVTTAATACTEFAKSEQPHCITISSTPSTRKKFTTELSQCSSSDISQSKS